MTAPAVRLSGLEAQLGGRRVLGPLDLELPPGEHALVVGPSGSGKTTLLRVLAGLEVPTAGRVELFGALASEGRRLRLAPAKRGVGLLFQGGALWPHMSCLRTLTFVLARRGVPRAERRARAERLLAQVELTPLAARRPGELSGGEAQRLNLARALAMEPRLLLLDEPLGPLDAELRVSLLARLAEVQRELELTVLHVTHDPREARDLATRTLRLTAEGRLAAPAAAGADEEGAA